MCELLKIVTAPCDENSEEKSEQSEVLTGDLSQYLDDYSSVESGLALWDNINLQPLVSGEERLWGDKSTIEEIGLKGDESSIEEIGLNGDESSIEEIGLKGDESSIEEIEVKGDDSSREVIEIKSDERLMRII